MGFTRVSLSANQAGENVYFSNVAFSGDAFNANGYGTFQPQDGLRCRSVPPNGSGGGGRTGQNDGVPLVITGRLLNPVLRVMKKRTSAELTLFHID